MGVDSVPVRGWANGLGRVLSALRLVVVVTLVILTNPRSVVAEDLGSLERQATGERVLVEKVHIGFRSRRWIREFCGERALACAIRPVNAIVLPEDRPYGWTGTLTSTLRVKWHTHESMRAERCDNVYACVRDGVIHAVRLDYGDRGIVRLGEAYAEAIGISYNPRRFALLAHELKHIFDHEPHDPWYAGVATVDRGS